MKQLILGIIFCIFVITANVNNMHAQILQNDKNWDIIPVFNDEFNYPHTEWDTLTWRDTPDNRWRATITGGVTHGSTEYQVYQRDNAIFNSDSTLVLRADTASPAGELIPLDYEFPDSCYPCSIKPNDDTLYYYSGAVINPIPYPATTAYLYGYFEARCKLPVQKGDFPAFWLYKQTPGHYREIDIFEWTWGISDNSTRKYQGNIWLANNTTYASYGTNYYTIPDNEPDLSNWHTYGVEWSPKRVVWYFDGKPVNEFFSDSVPAYDMHLIFNYAINKAAIIFSEPITTGFPRDMTIDYVKVNKLKCDCDSDAVIQNNAQLDTFNYAVKKSVTIDGSSSAISVPANEKVTLRATESVTITGEFEVPLGSEFEIITHNCPE
ncbi:MAG TPA: hypothetical protein DEH02_17605 [Bacteroidales bacterium]|nr:hypothetical protein [Bacteroidales bacterium]